MVEKLPLDPKTEIFKWGPVPVFIYFASNPFVGLLETFARLFPGYGWPKGLILFKDRRMIWMHENAELDSEGARLFSDYFLDKEKRSRGWKLWEEKRDAVGAASSEFDSVSFKKVSDEDFINMWHAYNACINEYWAHATLPELAGHGAIEILRNRLEQHVPASEIPQVMEILSAPEELSFYQQEEVELSSTEDVHAHQKKYYWLNNSYAHVETLPVSFFEKRKVELPATFVKDTYARLEKVKAEKKKIQALYALPHEVMDIATAMCDSMV